MLLLIQGTANELTPSLSERITLTGTVHFLMRFIEDETLEETSCIAVYTSGAYEYRYHTLTVTEQASVTTSDRQSGKVTLRPEGFWTYEIYEQTSTTNLDYTQATSRLEVGKAKVIPTVEVTMNEYTGGSSQTNTYSG